MVSTKCPLNGCCLLQGIVDSGAASNKSLFSGSDSKPGSAVTDLDFGVLCQLAVAASLAFLACRS